jgi:uncharacterized protein (DUF1778 family)|tara:strand:- start:222 stop:407 length:186 start_codon:yes stop_codon:yes gene_type:complete
MAERTERLEIRLTRTEKADLRELADLSDMTITEFVLTSCRIGSKIAKDNQDKGTENDKKGT